MRAWRWGDDSGFVRDGHHVRASCSMLSLTNMKSGVTSILTRSMHPGYWHVIGV